MPDAHSITVVGDREADFYELLLALPSEQVNLLIRCSKNRKLEGHPIKLFEWTDQLLSQGKYTIDLPRTDKRSAHTALLEVRFGKVKIARPDVFWNTKAPKSMEITVVDVRE